MPRLKIGDRWVGDSESVYFVADVGANHDGSLERAKMLIRLTAEAGANAAKFQNFRAPKIVSQMGFSSMPDQLSHQATWKKPVYQMYKEASVPWEWTKELKAECDAVGIDYFSTPYDFEAIDMLDPYVPVFKIGSGDITWTEMLRKVAEKGKPVILSSGASDMLDVERAVKAILEVNPSLILLQCNTNYTGSRENFRHIHLNVLRTYQQRFPEVIIGLSDHTPGHATVLGAVAYGARVIEKHFTDDNRREGPDHLYAMNPDTWRDMVERTRELEFALGSAQKKVADNERETVVIQRRCLRAARNLKAGTVLTRELIDILRPAPPDAIFPYDIDRVLGKRVLLDVPAGECLRWAMVESRG